jgi:hypothetical protein
MGESNVDEALVIKASNVDGMNRYKMIDLGCIESA